MVIAGSPGLLSARVTTVRGTLARSANLVGDQPIEIRAAKSCEPVTTPFRSLSSLHKLIRPEFSRAVRL